VSWILIYFHNYSFGQTKLDFPVEEFQNRRIKAMQMVKDGLIIFQATTTPKNYEQHAYLQNPNFYYFTGLSSAMSSILVMDCIENESLLFTPPDLNTRSYYKPFCLIEISERSERKLKIDKILDWNEFAAFIDRRLKEQPDLKIYTEKETGPENGPSNLNRIMDSWRHTLLSRWPDINIEDATNITSLRLIKSPLEIEALRKAGEITVQAFRAGLLQIEPGMTVRELQGIYVKECTCNNGNGIYFWPFIGSGKYSIYQYLRSSFVDYTLFNHVMNAGELVRIDIGCDYNHYKGDFGRTVPVSGKYDDGQREVWDLLVAGYLAGLEIIKDGVAFSDVFETFNNVISEHKGIMRTDLGKKAVDLYLSGKAMKRLILHNQGLGGYEGSADTCRIGMVLAWEPKFAVDDQGFYLEDMILVTKAGYEILTPGVPYKAREIEKIMGQ